ncbi:MAG: sugar transferase [Pseudomonadota bacterium]
MKRLSDIIGSATVLILFAPILALLLVLTALFLGRPVLFVQKRPGKEGIPFDLVKIRTMKDLVDASGEALPDCQRLTGYGRFLRSTSLDELPSLYNVLKGDMSLVGPRPLLMEYLPLYSARQMRRHDVRPGITGWAQVNGRNAISWEEKFLADIWYVENQSFALDIKILLLTAIKVFKREGISSEGEATMPRFTGREE